MRILAIAPFPYPPRSGGQARIFNIIKRLSQRHEVVLVSLIDEEDLPYVDEMRRYCSSVHTVAAPAKASLVQRGLRLLREPKRIGRLSLRGLRMVAGAPYMVALAFLPELQRKVEELLERGSFDILEAHYIFMAQYALGPRTRICGIKRLLSDLDASFVPYQHRLATAWGLSWLKSYYEFATMKRYASKVWQQVDRVIAMSEKDREAILSVAPTAKVAVVPNGVAVPQHLPESQGSVPPHLVFLGSLWYYPNIDAAIYFYREVFPLVRRQAPTIRLTIIGESPRGQLQELAKDPSVALPGYVEDLQPYLDEGAVFVVPLRIGGGTRLKILEAMAHGVPVVSTPIGCEGLDVTPGENILVAETPSAFAEHTAQLIASPPLRRSIGDGGRKLVEERYSWENIVGRLEEVYKEVMREERGRGFSS